MEGTVETMQTNVIKTQNEAGNAAQGQSFAASVQTALERYFNQLDGEQPSNVYQMVLAEMEVPLLKTVMQYTNGNQSRAAKVLGLSRGTLRKKLAIYQLENER